MAIAASSGVTSPAIASGTNTRVVADGDGEILQGHAVGGARDGERLQHRREPLALEDGVGGGLADVGRRGRRQRGVRGSQCRRVVETVADHQHLAALRLQLLEARDLLRRQDAGRPAVDARLAGRRFDHAGRSPDSSSVAKPARASVATTSAASGRNRSSKCERAVAVRRPARYHTAAASRAGASAPHQAPSRAVRRHPVRCARARSPPPRARRRQARPRGPPLRPRGPRRGRRGGGSPRRGCAARQDGIADVLVGGQRRLAQRQRAGLVEHDRVDLGQPLQPVGALTRTPLPNSRLVAATCTAGTARASAQGQVMISTAMAAVSAASQPWPAQQPAEEGDEPQHVHARRVEARRAVGEPHVAPACLLGGRHQPRDLGQQRVLVGGGRFDDQRSGQVDGAGIDRCAGATVRGAVSPVIRLSSTSPRPSSTRPSTAKRSPADGEDAHAAAPAAARASALGGAVGAG